MAAASDSDIHTKEARVEMAFRQGASEGEGGRGRDGMEARQSKSSTRTARSAFANPVDHRGATRAARCAGRVGASGGRGTMDEQDSSLPRHHAQSAEGLEDERTRISEMLGWEAGYI